MPEERPPDNTVIAEDARVSGMTFDNTAVLGDTMRWLQSALRWTQGDIAMRLLRQKAGDTRMIEGIIGIMRL